MSPSSVYEKVVDGKLCVFLKGQWKPYSQEELTDLYLNLKNDILYHADTLSTLLEELKK